MKKYIARNQVIAGRFTDTDVVYIPTIKTFFVKSIPLTQDSVKSIKLVSQTNQIYTLDILWINNDVSTIEVDEKYYKLLCGK